MQRAQSNEVSKVLIVHKAEISISHIFKWRRFPYEAARSTYYLTVRDFKYIFKEKKITQLWECKAQSF